MRGQYVDRCDLLNVINAYFSSYITCTVHMLVYNMVHIFAWVNEWIFSFCAVLAHVVSCTSGFVWLISTAEF